MSMSPVPLLVHLQPQVLFPCHKARIVETLSRGTGRDLQSVQDARDRIQRRLPKCARKVLYASLKKYERKEGDMEDLRLTIG